jgi:hypothetical protein
MAASVVLADGVVVVIIVVVVVVASSGKTRPVAGVENFAGILLSRNGDFRFCR